MPIRHRQKVRSNRGFTIPEAIIVVLIGTVLIGVVHTVFSRTLFATNKGTDNLETIRLATKIIREIRKDLLNCQSIDIAPGASVTVNVGEDTWDDFPDGANKVVFQVPNGFVEYALETPVSGKPHLAKKTSLNGNEETIFFGENRLVDFKAQMLWKRQQIFSGTTFQDGVLRVELELDSRSERFPSKNVTVRMFLTSKHLTSSKWRHF